MTHAVVIGMVFKLEESYIGSKSKIMFGCISMTSMRRLIRKMFMSIEGCRDAKKWVNVCDMNYTCG